MFDGFIEVCGGPLSGAVLFHTGGNYLLHRRRYINVSTLGRRKKLMCLHVQYTVNQFALLYFPFLYFLLVAFMPSNIIKKKKTQQLKMKLKYFDNEPRDKEC